VFAPGRCFDQIRVSVAQSRLNVKVVSTHAGLTVGEDGASHQALEDLALIGSLPGFAVIVPADAIETAQADFDTLGIVMRGYHDFGVALQDPRGGVKSKGEA
jgi:transketolase